MFTKGYLFYQDFQNHCKVLILIPAHRQGTKSHRDVEKITERWRAVLPGECCSAWLPMEEILADSLTREVIMHKQTCRWQITVLYSFNHLCSNFFKNFKVFPVHFLLGTISFQMLQASSKLCLNSGASGELDLKQ